MNLKKIAASAMMIGTLAGLPLLASAGPITLSFSPSAQNIAVGGSTSVDIFADVGPGAGSILANYSLLFTYDRTVVQLNSFSQNLDPFGGATDTVADVVDHLNGTVDFAIYSLLTDLELDALQGDNIKLATLSFTGLSIGTSPLHFDFPGVGYGCVGANGDPADCSLPPGGPLGSITVTGGGGNVVPEPFSAALVLTALGALALSRRKH